MKTKTLILSLCCLLILVLISVPRAYGGEMSSLFTQMEQSVDCRALDVVILIDQSDSMFDTNDRTGNRFDAAKTIVQVLGNHAVWLCLDQNVQHRVAVVGFGDIQLDYADSGDELADDPFSQDTRVYLEDQIVPPVNSFENWKEDRAEVERKIETGERDRLGATDHKAALQRARVILESWQTNPLPGAPRRQAIILITDGEPCLITRGCGEVGDYDIQPDLDSIAELTDPRDNDFPWRGTDNPNSVHISLIAMSRRTGPFPEAFFRTWEAVTQGHGGDVYPANDINTNLNTIVTDILNPVIGSGLEPVPCETDIWVNPYIDNLIVLYAFSLADNLADVESAVITIDTGENVIEVQGGDSGSSDVTIAQYVQDERNEYYIFSRPIPGRYRVSLPGPGTCQSELDIRLDKDSVVFEVETPTSTSTYPAVEPPNPIAAEKFRVHVFETRGDGLGRELLEEFPQYPLIIDATVASDDGPYTKSLLLQRVDTGVYESTEYIPAPVAGGYSWTLTATVKNPNPEAEALEVFSTSGRYAASAVEPFGFEIAAPVDGSEHLLGTNLLGQPQPRKIPVLVTLVNKNGQPVDANDYLTKTDGLFQASLIKGTSVIESIPLSLQPGSGGKFYGEFANSSSGTVVEEGDYRIEVKAQWSADHYNSLKYLTITNTQVTNIHQFSFDYFEFPEEILLIEDAPRKPLRIVVKVTGEGGGNPQQLLEAAIPNLTASLIKEQGNVVSQSAFHLEGNLLIAELESGNPDPLAFSPGCYLVVVEQNISSREEILSAKVCMIEVKALIAAIEEPEMAIYTLHPLLQWFPPVEPVPLSVVVFAKADPQTPLNPAEVLATGHNGLFSGELMETCNTAHPINFVADQEGARFVAQWPEDADSQGTYTLRVSWIEDAMQKVWLPAEPLTLQTQFSRDDSLLHQPWALLALSLLILLLLGCMVWYYYARGPLAGAFLEFKRGNYLIANQDVFSCLNRRRFKRKVDLVLGENDVLTTLAVRLEEPEMENARIAAEVTLAWQPEESDSGDGDIVIVIEEGEELTIFDDLTMVLQKRPQGVCLAAWLVLLMPVAAWLGTFGWLYFNSLNSIITCSP